MEQPVHFYNHHGEKLIGTLHLPDGPAHRGVVFGHCFTCSRHTGIIRHICSELEREAFMALRFDFSGNGQSQGRFDESTYSKQIQEMKIATAFIAEKGAQNLPQSQTILLDSGRAGEHGDVVLYRTSPGKNNRKPG